MEVREGYKQTEVGVIPNDWDFKRLEEIGDPIIGLTYKPSDVTSDGLLVLRSSNIRNDKLIFDDNVFVDLKVSEKLIVKENDVLICVRNGSRNLIGKCALINDVAKGMTFGAFMSIFRSSYGQYVFHQFQSELIKRQINENIGATINQITNKNLNSFIIPFPRSEAEQHAIAEALSDADALIEALEQLIDKKRLVKQGAMQELLTGKRRLPGFSGEWENKSLEELIDCLDNLRIPLNENQRMQMQGDIPYCGANGVLDYVNDFVVDDDIVLIAEDGGYFDEYATRPIAYRMSGKCWVNNHAHILKAKNGICQDFIYYSLVHKNIMSLLASGTRAKLNKSQLFKIEIMISSEEAEQAAIAEILNDMDAEIDALEKKLGKTRQVKQGMMQELLTGRIRLV